jgi:hypothetical protein
MKLSPPASSSDLDVARGIARRLSRLATPQGGGEAPLPPYSPHSARPAARAPEAPRPEPRVEPRPAPPPPPAATPSPQSFETVRMDAPTRASAEPRLPPVMPKPAPPPPRPAPPPPPGDEEVGVLPDDEPAPPPPPRPAPAPRQAPAPAPAPKAAPARPAPPPPPPPPEPEPEPEASDILLESEGELAGEAEVALPDMDEDFEAAAKAAADAVPDAVPDVEPELEAAPPTWAELLQDCLYLARASGALLIDAQGEVVASCGDWPSPGVDHIAARLVPAMDKALKTAPTRSVSVPIGNLHLTAWRVNSSDSTVTVGFVAEAPLKAEVRPAIDAEIKRGFPA